MESDPADPVCADSGAGFSALAGASAVSAGAEAGTRRAGRWVRVTRGALLAAAGCAVAGAADEAPVWAALMASTSCAFFMEPAPDMPMPAAIDLRSARSMELSPPPRFLALGVAESVT